MMPPDLIREAGPYATLLVGPVPDGCHLVPYQIEILVRHRPAWLVPCYVRHRDGQHQICQDLTGLVALDQAFSASERSPAAGSRIIRSVTDCLEAAADHLLPPGQISLDPSLVFLDRNREIRLLFWPFLPDTQPEQLADCTDCTDGADGADDANGTDTEMAAVNERLAKLVRAAGLAFAVREDVWQSWVEIAVNRGASGLASHLASGEPDLAGNLPAGGSDQDTRLPAQKPDQVKPDDLHDEHPVSPRAKTGRSSTPAHPASAGQPVSRPDRQARHRNTAKILMILLHAALPVLLAARWLGRSGWQDQGNPAIGSPVLLIYTGGLFCLDLWLCRSWLRSVPLLQRICSWFSALSGQVQASPDDSCSDADQTVLLAAAGQDFRMAMLSEGKPGTPDEQEGLRAFILIDEFLIGRDSQKNDLVVPDSGVGRIHARITRHSGSFFICDLGSRNGTTLDGRRLPRHTEQLLPDQCVLEFASHSFFFQAD